MPVEVVIKFHAAPGPVCQLKVLDRRHRDSRGPRPPRPRSHGWHAQLRTANSDSSRRARGTAVRRRPVNTTIVPALSGGAPAGTYTKAGPARPFESKTC